MKKFNLNGNAYEAIRYSIILDLESVIESLPSKVDYTVLDIVDESVCRFFGESVQIFDIFYNQINLSIEPRLGNDCYDLITLHTQNNIKNNFNK